MPCKLIQVTCPECGKERPVQSQQTKGERFTGLCRDCYIKKLTERRVAIPISERKIQKRAGDGYLYINLPEEHWLVPMSQHQRKRRTYKLLYHRFVMAEHLGLVIENNGLKNFLDGVKSALESLPPRMLRDL